MASPAARSTGSDFNDRDKTKRKRVKRIPIADLDLQSFQKDRSVQGTVVLCESSRNQETDSRYFMLKDIVVSPKAAISAAGLDPRESEDRFEQQAKKRGQDTPVVHTIQVILRGPFSTIPLSVGDVVLLKGSDVAVTINEEKTEASDHHLLISVEKGNSEMEVIPVLQDSTGARRKKPSAALSYSEKAARFYLEGSELMTAIRSIKKNHPEVDFAKLQELKVNDEYQNTYGVVVNANFPSRTQKGTWRLAIHLVDETHPSPENPIEVCAFAPKEHLLEYLPEMTCFGTIVRLHRVKVSTFQDHKSLRMVSHVTTMTTANMESGNQDQNEVDLEGATSKTNLDWHRVEQLRAFASGIVTQGGQPSFLYNKYMKTLTEVFNGTGTEDRAMVDVLVKLLTVPKLVPDADQGEGYSFDVTDGHTVATVLLRRELATEATDPPSHYWPLVVRFVGVKAGEWVKIRNCQVAKNERMLFAFCGDGNLKATSFLRIPDVFCQETQLFVPPPLHVTQASGFQKLPKQIVSQVHASAQSMQPVPLSHAIGRLGQPPFRVIVRVANVFPSEIAQMCRARADGFFSWKVALQLEDTSGRVDAVLTGDDATEFFQLQPLDLETNEESRKIVELAVLTLKSENCWLDCVLVPLVESGQVFAIVDTVVRV